MSGSPPHVGLLYQDQIPAALIDEFRDAVATEGLDLHIEGRPTTHVFAGVEWVLPTAAMLFVAKAYFDGFLTEAGNDHYQALKAGAKRLGERLAAVKTTRLGSPGKVSADQRYSLVYSIWFGPVEGYSFKFLVPNNPAEAAVALDAYMEFLERFALAMRSPERVAELLAASGTTRLILLAYNPDTGQVERLDPMTRAFRSL